MPQHSTSGTRKSTSPAIGGKAFESDPREASELAPETLVPSTERARAHQLANESHDREERIAQRAHWHAAQRGFEPGHELDDWLQAEKEIDAEQVDEVKPEDQFTG
ncbi:MAG TPA: DUF2934 domain-containing protein [Steroidobacteraceae bacterium]|nr:DUF2934 domain-containing protein [Steroidobacteraceae bacterium]